MARSARTPKAVEAVLDLLRKEAKPLDVAAIKRRMAKIGIADVDAVWASVGPVLRAHAQVQYAGKRYGLVEPATQLSINEALQRLGTDLPEAQRAALVSLIQTELDAVRQRAAEADALRAQAAEVAALRERLLALEGELASLRTAPPAASGPAPGQTQAEYERAERRRAARERNARVEAMTKVADLAGEVEELVAKRATSEVLLESTRALVSVAGLEQIGAGGERTVYDESLHEPIGDTPKPGAPVVVVRPGYRWNAPGEVVLIGRAQVRRA